MDNKKEGAKLGAAVVWKKLPFKVKLIVIGAIAVLFGLIFLVAIIVSIESMHFLDFSNDTKTKIDTSDNTDDYVEEYESYWGNICTSGDKNCSEETAENTEEYLKQQKKFYNKLNKFSRKKNLNSKEQNILLTTAFYGYNMDEFSENGGAFTNTNDLDDENEGATIDPEAAKRETKSVKKLAKALAKGEDSYYNFLLTEDYLDDKPIAAIKYQSYAQKNGLDSDYTSWDDEDKMAVREYMVQEIKDIVEEYEETSGSGDSLSRCVSGDYWLPIGSSDTTNEGGNLFASGTPISVVISSHAFARDSAHQDHDHGGTDFANSSGTIGNDYIIASVDGKVTSANDSCPSTGGLGNNCGGGFGNFVYIQDAKGYVEIYGHMAKGTVAVKEGETVKQGQVLGKIGSSGSSTGPHLHFEMHDPSGNKVDPEDFVSIDNPRPSGSGNSSSCLGAVSGDSNIQTVCLSLKNAGYPDAGVAAALINFTHEAHYDSACINSIGAAGMAQWYQGRYDALVNQYGEDWILVENQVEYYLSELDNEVKPGSKNILMNASDVGSTAESFCNKFEVPGAAECAKRNSSSTATKYLEFVKNECQGNVVRMGPDTADCVRRHGEFSEDLQ